MSLCMGCIGVLEGLVALCSFFSFQSDCYGVSQGTIRVPEPERALGVYGIIFLV